MKKFSIVGAFVAVFLFSVYSLLPFTRPDSRAASKPNIVVVMFDDATKADVESMPNIKSLIADQGATFDRFYATESICCPNRASILTGEYVHNHGVDQNDDGYHRFTKKGHEQRVFTKILKGQGYSTAYIGKYLNAYSSKHVPPYWDKWFAGIDLSPYRSKFNHNGSIVQYGKKPEDYIDTLITRQSEQWMNTQISAGTPYFAFISVRAPHSPYVAPPNHQTEFLGDQASSRQKPSFNEANVAGKPRYIRNAKLLTGKQKAAIDQRYRMRLRMMLETDDFVGRLVGGLTSKGELDNTYIFVTSDNGWMQGEHRLPAQKLYPYEEANHLPLFVRGPGIQPGTKIRELASSIDLYSTFTELAGQQDDRDGRSLFELLNGTSTSWRTQILIENLAENQRLPKLYGVVDHRYKYIEYQTSEKELYDLASDPYETNSLYRSVTKALIDSLKVKLDALKSCHGDSCRAADRMQGG